MRREKLGEAGAQSTTPTYTTGKDSPAREPSWSALWLQKPSILRVHTHIKLLSHSGNAVAGV